MMMHLVFTQHDGLANEGKKLEEKDIKDGRNMQCSYFIHAQAFCMY